MAVERVGAVPLGKSQKELYASVLEPVPSWFTKIEPDCPTTNPVGLPRVLFPPKVTVKLLDKVMSTAMVAASVSVVTVAASGPSSVSVLAVSPIEVTEAPL